MHKSIGPLAVSALLALCAWGETPRVAVLSFETLSGNADDQWIGAGFAETLTNKLSAVESSLQLIERRRVADILRAQGITQERVEQRESQHVGSMLGVDYLVLGSVQLLGTLDSPDSPVRVNTRVVRVETGEIVAGQSLTMDGRVDGLFDLQSDLALKCCEILNVQPLMGEKQLMLRSETRSLEAYRFFSMANVYLDSGRYRDAIRLYDEALKAHEDYYVEAHHNQGTAYQRLTNSQDSQELSNETAQEYEERVNRLTTLYSQVFFEQGRMYMFRKKHRQGIEAYDKFLKNANVPKTVFWQTYLHVGTHYFTYWVNDMVLQSTYAGIFALDDRTGSVLWQSPHTGIRIPVTDGVRLFVLTQKNGLLSLDLRDGSQIRSFPSAGESLTYRDGVLLNSRSDGLLEAFDADKGSVLWRSERAYTGRFNMKAPVHEDVVYVGRGSNIVALDLHTGSETDNLSLPWEAKGLALQYPVIVAYDGHSEFAAVELKTREVLWRRTLDSDHLRKHFLFADTVLTFRDDYGAEDGGALVALDLATGEDKWQRQVLGPGHASYGMVGYGNTTYINRTMHLVAADLATGDIWWTYPQGGFSWSQLAFHEGRLFCANTYGRVTCLNATPERPPHQDYRVQFEIARAKRHLGQYDDARTSLRSIIRTAPRIKADCHMELALIARAEKNSRAEVFHLLEVLRNGHKKSVPADGIGSLQEGLAHSKDDAVVQARKALAETIGLKWFTSMENAPIMKGRHPQGTSGLSSAGEHLLVPINWGLEIIDRETGRIEKAHDLTTLASLHFSMSPVVQFEDLYILQDAMDRVVAIHSESGDVVWSLPQNHMRNDYFRRELILKDDTLYFCHSRGVVFAADARSGDLRWAFALDYDSFAGLEYRNGRLFIGDHDEQIHAIDAESGRHLWKTHLGSPIYAPPTSDETNLYVGAVDGTVTCLVQATGRILWRSQTGGPIATRPYLWNQLLIVASNDRHIYALDKTSGEIVWRTLVGMTTETAPVKWQDQLIFTFWADADILGLDPETGNIEWSMPRSRSWDLAPHVQDGVLFTSDFWDGAVYAVDLRKLQDYCQENPLWRSPEEEVSRTLDSLEDQTLEADEREALIDRLVDFNAPEEARAECDRWIEQHPDAPHAWFALGLVEHEQHQFKEAHAALSRAFELGYRKSRLHKLMADSAYECGQLRDAVDACTRYRQISFHEGAAGAPRALWATFNLAAAHDQADRTDEARAVYREILDRDVFVVQLTDPEGVARTTRNGSEFEHLRRFLELEDDQSYRDRICEKLERLYTIRYCLDYLDDSPFAEVISRTRPDDPWFQGLLAAKKLADGAQETSLWETVSDGLRHADSLKCPVGIDLILRPLRRIAGRVQEEAPATVKDLLSSIEDARPSSGHPS